jgi:hypothetical protein
MKAAASPAAPLVQVPSTESNRANFAARAPVHARLGAASKHSAPLLLRSESLLFPDHAMILRATSTQSRISLLSP